MKVYWITFENGAEGSIFHLGAGVTAKSEEDALELLRLAAHASFGGYSVLSVRELKSIEELDQKHVVPNMGSPMNRGVWFPVLSGCS